MKILAKSNKIKSQNVLNKVLRGTSPTITKTRCIECDSENIKTESLYNQKHTKLHECKDCTQLWKE